jgi:hypothetical protein
MNEDRYILIHFIHDICVYTKLLVLQRHIHCIWQSPLTLVSAGLIWAGCGQHASIQIPRFLFQ